MHDGCGFRCGDRVMYDAEPLALRLSAVVLCSNNTSLSTSGQQRFCFRTITCTARITVGMRAITCTARITVGMRAITCTARITAGMRVITRTARITVGMRAITCTARITAGMRAITRTRTSGVRTITRNASAGSMKYRQHTLENAGKFKKQRMVSGKTGSGKVEITRPYVGKRRQVSKATYG